MFLPYSNYWDNALGRVPLGNQRLPSAAWCFFVEFLGCVAPPRDIKMLF